MSSTLISIFAEVSKATRPIWFLNTYVTFPVGAPEGKDDLSVLEHRAPCGDSPPMHIHHTEDEVFHILEGELTIRVGNETGRYGPGAVLVAPKGIPHSYRVDSSEGGRWVTVTAHGDFERFVRAVGREAENDELPPPVHLSPEAIEQVAAVARTFGIELAGPPMERWAGSTPASESAQRQS